jgi:hypothetical protein
LILRNTKEALLRVIDDCYAEPYTILSQSKRKSYTKAAILTFLTEKAVTNQDVMQALHSLQMQGSTQKQNKKSKK